MTQCCDVVGNTRPLRQPPQVVRGIRRITVAPPTSEPGRDTGEPLESGGLTGEDEQPAPPEGKERRRGPRIDLSTLKGSWSQRREQLQTDREDADETP